MEYHSVDMEGLFSQQLRPGEVVNLNLKILTMYGHQLSRPYMLAAYTHHIYTISMIFGARYPSFVEPYHPAVCQPWGVFRQEHLRKPFPNRPCHFWVTHGILNYTSVQSSQIETKCVEPSIELNI